MTDGMPLEVARSKLAWIWFGGGAVLVLLLVAQSILGKFPDSLQQVWAWFTPTIFPTVALMVGVMGAAALQPGIDKRVVKTSFFKFARALSIFYVGILLLTMLLQPFSPMRSIELFSVSNYWLAPIESVVVASITVLFTSHQKASGT